MAFMLAKAPLDRPQPIPEDPASGRARYEQIAKDVAEVVRTEPSLYKGPDGKLRTTMVVLSTMLFESNFRYDVDYGIGPSAKGDQGRSVCMMQINVGNGRSIAWNTAQNRFAWPHDPPEEVQRGYTAKELVGDRQTCIRTGLRYIRMSFQSCHHMPEKDWLRAYVSGVCHYGAETSMWRMDTAKRWYRQHPPGFDDTVLVAKDEEDDEK